MKRSRQTKLSDSPMAPRTTQASCPAPLKPVTTSKYFSSDKSPSIKPPEKVEMVEDEDEDEDEDENDAEVDTEENARPTKLHKTNTNASASSQAAIAALEAASRPSIDITLPKIRANPAVLSFDDSILTQPIENYQAAFDRIARDILFDYELVSNGVWFRLLEIEMYWRGDEKPGHPSHHDIFAHGHPVQLNNYGKWYFHRQGQKPTASFKGGNYKGADVTFGPKSGGGHGGILIRSVQRISDGAIIEGSCLVADEILRTHKMDSLMDMHESWKGNTCAFTGPTLFFTPAQHRVKRAANTPAMIKSPRVGLTLKQAGETRPKYIMLPYRYTVLVDGKCFNKKQKQTIVMSVYEELGSGKLSTIRYICDCNSSYLDRLIASYDSGKKLKSMEKWIKDTKSAVNAEGMAQMYGAWMSLYGPKPHIALKA